MRALLCGLGFHRWVFVAAPTRYVYVCRHCTKVDPA